MVQTHTSSPTNREREGQADLYPLLYPPRVFQNRLRRCRDSDHTADLAPSTFTEMFKFDFVHDSDDEHTQTAQNEKGGANEPGLTEILLIKLVRTP